MDKERLGGRGRLDRAQRLVEVSGEPRRRLLDSLLQEAERGDGGQALHEILVAATAGGEKVVSGRIAEILATARRIAADRRRPAKERAKAWFAIAEFQLHRPLPALEVGNVVGDAFLAATGLLGEAPAQVARAAAHLLASWDMELLLEGTPFALGESQAVVVLPDLNHLDHACQLWFTRLNDKEKAEAERAAAGVLLLATRRGRREKGIELESLVDKLVPALRRKIPPLEEVWLRVRHRIQRSRRAVMRLQKTLDVGSVAMQFSGKGVFTTRRLRRGIRPPLFPPEPLGEPTAIPLIQPFFASPVTA